MTDPFSIVAGTFGILDVCLRTISYVRNVKAAAKEIESSLNALISEIESLQNVVKLVQKLWLEHADGLDPDEKPNSHIADHWKAVNTTLQNCKVSMTAFEEKIHAISGPVDAGTVTIKNRLDGFKKTIKKHSKEAEIQSLRTEVMSQQESLQILLQVLSFLYTQRSQASIGRGMQNLSDEVISQGFTIRRQLDTLLSRTDFMDSEHSQSLVDMASRAVANTRLNQHFYLPRPVNSLYTGRDAMLERLREAIRTSDPSNQCRFVICGLGGSGKTEFCCKFAQENRDSYWGIFSVDGKSEQTIRHGFASIAKLAKLGDQLGENADVAGKNWLANLVFPWLLIIDNVDTMSIDELQKHFPAGEGGVILITTRTSDLRLLGTTSPGFFDFGREIMDEDDSNELLLRAANESRRTTPILEAARKIARRLGYLPLALIQAGRAILKQISRCTLENYLEVYERSWNYVRRKIVLDPSRASLSTDGIVNVNVYSSFAISFRGLENTRSLPAQDAVDLLKLFSFLSNESIKYAILKTSIYHARQKKEYDREEEEKTSKAEGNAWIACVKAGYLWYLRQIDKSAPSLPYLLRDEHFDAERLNDALDQLLTLSLISYDGGDESYSMHPLIHLWVREQPEMRTAEQALWCEVASSVLAQSILLPPLDTTPTAEELRRHLLPHVIHVQKYRGEIRQRLTDNTRARQTSWKPVKPLEPIFTRQLAFTYAKFSLIYFSNGHLVKAEELQLQVLDFIVGRLGEDNEGAWLIKLFLSQTYAMQTNFNKAADLQEAVLTSSTKVLGESHTHTLKYMTILGATRAYQTRLKESRQLLQTAIKGFSKALSPSADEVLDAKHHLGRTLRRYLEYKTCHQLYEEAFEGLSVSSKYGPMHEKTWEAKEDFAMSMLDLDGSDLDRAFELVRDVKHKRKEKFGTQHPLTLLSRCNLARVESARGHHDKAEKIISKHLPTAVRNLGEHHFGTLMGKTYQAQIIARQKRFDEAEVIYKQVTNPEHYSSSSREDGEHLDRLYALRLLMEMYMDWGRPQAALQVCDEIEAGAARIGGEKLGLQHPIIEWLKTKRQEILRSADPEVETSNVAETWVAA